MSSQERAARAYTRRGWIPLPLNWVLPDGSCSCQRAGECGNPGKHPRVRWKDRTAVDAEELGRWWRWWPRAGVGVKTGAVSGMVVIDVDPRHGGDTTLALLEDTYGTLPETLTAETGGGGLHLVFQHPGFNVQNVQNDEHRKLGPGLDVRGDGGQIAAAPTLHASGRRYRWRDWNAEPAPMPAWLANRLRPPVVEHRPVKPVTVGARLGRYAGAALEGELRRVAEAQEGSRNETLFLSACRLGELVGAGVLGEAVAGQHLLRAALDRGITEGEAKPTILSGLNTGAANPRAVAR